MYLKSGSLERGSTRGLVTLLARPASPRGVPVRPQCIGTNTTPGLIAADSRGRYPHHPVAAGNRHGTALADAQAGGVVGVQLGERAPLVLAELGDLAGAGHGVPLVAQPAGGEHERIVRARGLGRSLLRQVRSAGSCATGTARYASSASACSWSMPPPNSTL